MTKQKLIIAKSLVKELVDQVLKDGSSLELSAKGFYPRMMANIYSLGGSVDKTTEQLTRLKQVILELEKVICS